MSLTASGPAAVAGTIAQQRLTVGVEEEFLLLDPFTGQNTPMADDARAALSDDMLGLSRVEFRRSMMEMVTPVCTSLPQLRRHLAGNRSAAAAAAASVGAALVPVGATPIGEPDRTVEDTPRFHAIARHYGPIAHDPALCGCHVHVGVPDQEVAVQVCNHLRPWLPVVQALSANSPFHAGGDTCHASWRSIQLERWPSLGPSPYLESVAHYERTVAELVASGAMLDETMVLWWARPSGRYPTVEVRVADVCLAVEDTVLIAGLVRALVATALTDIAAGRSAPRVPGHLLRAAHWGAAHSGLDGSLTDVRRRMARPVWEMIDALVATVEAALVHHGDRDAVAGELTRLRVEGTGATRQRRAFERTGDLPAVLRELAVRV
ncbi:glutamate--cysteine ligase [Dactylosporangium cerinum]|uniref:Putative glutamate--cysteine ligase 2 n=1 Tax=Dactylosporangium cerinum TaxID=1434730 RepID=A0ABV9VU10_9ACTN